MPERTDFGARTGLQKRYTSDGWTKHLSISVSAHLCDATPVSVTYHVAADGSLVYDSSTGGAVTEKSKDHALFVRFNGTFVGMFAYLKSEGSGTYKLVVQGFSGFCGHSDKSGGDKGHGDSWGWGFGGGRPH